MTAPSIAAAPRQALGWFVLAMGAFVLLQLPVAALPPAGAVMGALAVAGGCALISARCLLRTTEHA